MADDRSTMPTAGTMTTTSDASAAEAQEAQEGADFLIEPAQAQALLRLRPGDHLSDFSNIDLTIQRVAQGGFGLVFLGSDASDGRMHALKTLRPDLLARSGDPQRLSQLFLREALTWVGLWPYDNLLTAYFATQINGVLFLVLDYAPLSLRDLLEQPQRVRVQGQAGAPGRLPLRAALSVAQQIAAGLVALHTPDPDHLRTEPLVHRDLKPENVLLDEDARAMITDFGLAKVVLDAEAEGDSGVADASDDTAPGQGQAVGGGAPTREANTRSRHYQTQRGAAMGTLAYMAPEQWVDAASAGPPADLYAFGIMLAELVTGQHPVLALGQAHTEEQWRTAHFTGTPRALRDVEPEVPEVLEALYQRLLAKRPEQRPTAAEAVQLLGEAAVALGEQPYTAAGIIQPTRENQRIFWQSWSNTYSRFGLLRGALQRIKQALALDPTSYQTLLNYGNCLKDLGRREEALAAYTTGLAKCPAEQTKWIYLLHGQLAICLDQMGRYAEADPEYAASLALMPDYASGWHNRVISQLSWAEAEAAAGRGEQQQEHLTLALAYARRALALNPQNPRRQQVVNSVEQELRAIGGA